MTKLKIKLGQQKNFKKFLFSKAIVMGKPENHFCEIFFKDEIKTNPKRFLMIGDRLNTDIMFGNRNNFQTLLVGTGVHSMSNVDEIMQQIEKRENDEELKSQIPGFYLGRLGNLFDQSSPLP